MGGQKRPRKKRREVDTVGRNVLEKDSPRTLEVGTGLKNTKNLYNIFHNIVKNILANPIQNVSTQPLLADIPAEFPPVQAVKPRALFQNSF